MSRKQSIIKKNLSFLSLAVLGLLGAQYQARESLTQTLPQTKIWPPQRPNVLITEGTDKISGGELVSLLPKEDNSAKQLARISEKEGLVLEVEGVSGNIGFVAKHPKFTSPDAEVMTVKGSSSWKVIPNILDGRAFIGGNLELNAVSRDGTASVDVKNIYFKLDDSEGFGSAKFALSNSEQKACAPIDKLLVLEPGSLFTPIDYAKNRWHFSWELPKSCAPFTGCLEIPPISPNLLNEWSEKSTPVDDSVDCAPIPEETKGEFRCQLKGDLKMSTPVTGAFSYEFLKDQFFHCSAGLNCRAQSLDELTAHEDKDKKKFKFLDVQQNRGSVAAALVGKFYGSYLTNPIEGGVGLKYGHYASYYEFSKKDKEDEEGSFFNLFNPKHHIAAQLCLTVPKMAILGHSDFSFGFGGSFTKSGDWGFAPQSDLAGWKKDEWSLDRRCVSFSLTKAFCKQFKFKIQLRYNPKCAWFTSQVPAKLGFDEASDSSASVFDRLGISFSLGTNFKEALKHRFVFA